jgi:hypothetical protein
MPIVLYPQIFDWQKTLKVSLNLATHISAVCWLNDNGDLLSASGEALRIYSMWFLLFLVTPTSEGWISLSRLNVHLLHNLCLDYFITSLLLIYFGEWMLSRATVTKTVTWHHTCCSAGKRLYMIRADRCCDTYRKQSHRELYRAPRVRALKATELYSMRGGPVMDVLLTGAPPTQCFLRVIEMMSVPFL